MNTVHVEQLAVLALDVVLWCMSVYRRATPVESAKYRWWLFRYKKTKHGIIYTKSVISETCEFGCIFYYHHNSSSPNLPSLRPIDIADWMPERDTWNHGRIQHFQVSAPRFLDTLKVYKISGSFLWRDAVFWIWYKWCKKQNHPKSIYSTKAWRCMGKPQQHKAASRHSSRIKAAITTRARKRKVLQPGCNVMALPILD